MNRADGAEQYFKDEKWYVSGIVRGVTLAYFGRTVEASALLTPARQQLLAKLEQTPSDHDALHALCDVSGALKMTAEAMKHCQSALDTFQADAMVLPSELFELASSLGAAGANEEALQLLKQLESSHGGPARTWIEAERRLVHLHDHPDWAPLMDALGPEQ